MVSMAFGYRPGKPHAHAHIGTALSVLTNADKLPELEAYPSFLPFRAGRVYQDNISECLPCSIKRAVQLYHMVRGNGTVLLSELLVYAVARIAEWRMNHPLEDADRRPSLESIGDVGSIPELTITALKRIGIVDETAWPGPASPSWRARRINDEPTPDCLVDAYDATGIEAFEVDRKKPLRDSVLELAPYGFAVICAINASRLARYNPRASIVRDLPASGQNHMVAILDATDRAFMRLDNWWDASPDGGPSWGDQSLNALGQVDSRTKGTWRVDPSNLDDGASDVLAIRCAPTLAKKGKAA